MAAFMHDPPARCGDPRRRQQRKEVEGRGPDPNPPSLGSAHRACGPCQKRSEVKKVEIEDFEKEDDELDILSLKRDVLEAKPQ